MMTEEPYWLKEAYSKESETLDVGRVNRSINNAEITTRLISNLKIESGPFLDFGGGDGLFTRIMRDKGYDYYLYDPLSDNRFAKFFDNDDLAIGKKYQLVTAYEVFEHVTDPMNEITKIFEVTDSLLLSTEVVPDNREEISSWWYLVPETGQHISFYDEKTFEYIGKKNGLNYQRYGNSYHLLTKRNINAPFKVPLAERISNWLNRKLTTTQESLTDADFQYYKGKMNV